MNNKTEKPLNPRIDVAPTVEYVLSVLQVEGFDAAARSYTPVVLPEIS
jgi:hypothetical protein